MENGEEDCFGEYEEKVCEDCDEKDECEKETSKKEQNEESKSVETGSQKIKCPKCGAKYEEDDEFCGECGTKLRSSGEGRIEKPSEIKKGDIISKKKRPLIAKTLIVLSFISGMLLLLGGFVGLEEEIIKSILAILVGIAFFVEAYGLFNLREWARKVALIIPAFFLVACVLYTIDEGYAEWGGSMAGINSFLGWLFLFSIPLAIIYDLQRKEVKDVFD